MSESIVLCSSLSQRLGDHRCNRKENLGKKQRRTMLVPTMPSQTQ